MEVCLYRGVAERLYLRVFNTRARSEPHRILLKWVMPKESMKKYDETSLRTDGKIQCCDESKNI